MDDDKLEYSLDLFPGAHGYIERYPSVVPRLREILATKDPKLRRRIAQLAKMQQDGFELLMRRIKATYGLTPSEARLAAHVISGGNIASYAKRAGVTAGTARTHLKSVFAKTGVTRQAELVKLGQTTI